jgi:hypothetical protein
MARATCRRSATVIRPMRQATGPPSRPDPMEQLDLDALVQPELAQAPRLGKLSLLQSTLATVPGLWRGRLASRIGRGIAVATLS